jgi:hypothetical protein
MGLGVSDITGNDTHSGTSTLVCPELFLLYDVDTLYTGVFFLSSFYLGFSVILIK